MEEHTPLPGLIYDDAVDTVLTETITIRLCRKCREKSLKEFGLFTKKSCSFLKAAKKIPCRTSGQTFGNLWLTLNKLKLNK